MLKAGRPSGVLASNNFVVSTVGSEIQISQIFVRLDNTLRGIFLKSSSPGVGTAAQIELTDGPGVSGKFG